MDARQTGDARSNDHCILTVTQMWNLPGPRGYISELVQCVDQGRHVIAILPTWLNESTGLVEDLADLIVRDSPNAAVVNVRADTPLVAALGDEVNDGFGTGPTTVPELLQWTERRAAMFVIIGSELPLSRRTEVKEFLDRLALESRSSTGTGDIRFVILVGEADLPDPLRTSGGDVTVAVRWFWNRVTRWDTLAILAASNDVDKSASLEGLAGEIRVETIAEVARWNLVLAQRLAQEWDGTPGALVKSLGGTSLRARGTTPEIAKNRVGAFPPPPALEAWNQGDVEGWRGRVSIAPTLSSNPEEAVSRFVWSAQARVLLPFVEERRTSLEAKVRETLGNEQFKVALKQCGPDPGGDDWVKAPVPELATLRTIISARIGRRGNRLFQIASVLRDTRNLLSHLTPLDERKIIELEKQCLWLG